VTARANGLRRPDSRAWAAEAVRLIDADANRSADTHLHAFPLPAEWGIGLYLKDESVHPTGSLKHRLARSLFLYALCNAWIGERTTIVEASSGSTAVSEAYFARLLGLPFVAVMPASTSSEKIALIEAQGGSCHLVDDPRTIVAQARRLAAEQPSFLPDIVDRMIQVPDAASIATMRLVRDRTGRSVGGSTGTNVWGALALVAEMRARGERGSIVTLICDGGERYAGTYYSDAWVADQGLDLAPYAEALQSFLEGGALAAGSRAQTRPP
jgi:cysteine synthase